MPPVKQGERKGGIVYKLPGMALSNRNGNRPETTDIWWFESSSCLAPRVPPKNVGVNRTRTALALLQFTQSEGICRFRNSMSSISSMSYTAKGTITVHSSEPENDTSGVWLTDSYIVCCYSTFLASSTHPCLRISPITTPSGFFRNSTSTSASLTKNRVPDSGRRSPTPCM